MNKFFKAFMALFLCAYCTLSLQTHSSQIPGLIVSYSGIKLNCSSIAAKGESGAFSNLSGTYSVIAYNDQIVLLTSPSAFSNCEIIVGDHVNRETSLSHFRA